MERYMENIMMGVAQKKYPRPSQRAMTHLSENFGFENVRYCTILKNNSMLPDLPPWYMILGAGTITALRTTRALLRIKLPMESDFETIYRLLRTICSNVTYDEVIDAMKTFFGPPRQNFEDFLLGFAVRDKNNESVAENKYSDRECLFYSAITFFTFEKFEHNLKTPIPPLTLEQIPPVLYWVLSQSVRNSADIVRAFKRLLLAAKSPYIRPLPNALISFRHLDQATRKFNWCDCEKNIIKYNYLHTKHEHKDYIWLQEDTAHLVQPTFIDKQPSFQKLLLREKERRHIPFSFPKPSLFKKDGKIVDAIDRHDYSHLVQKAKRVYEYKLNKNFKGYAHAFWEKYYKGNVPSRSEGKLFEMFKNYHHTQYYPSRQAKIKDVCTKIQSKEISDSSKNKVLESFKEKLPESPKSKELFTDSEICEWCECDHCSDDTIQEEGSYCTC